MDFHELANIFPMIPKEELEQLITDVKANGLIEPITLYQGKILDGRNRFIACQMAEVEPEFVPYNGNNPLTFVISKNIQRRHLSSSQRAAIAIDVLPMLEAEARERQLASLKQNLDSVTQFFGERNGRHSGEAAQQAADLFGTNRQYVSDAKKLKEDDPKIFEDIKNGKDTIPKAKKRNNRRKKREQAQEQRQTESESSIILHQANSLLLVPTLPDSSIPLVITDPPYNTTEYTWDNIGTDDEFILFTQQWLNAIRPKLTPNYHLFFFCDPDYVAPIEMLLRRDKWPLKSRIIWEYRNLVKGRDVADKFIENWQMCFHIGTHALNWSPDWDDKRFMVQNHATPQSNFTEGKYHPTQKPLSLIKLLVEIGSKSGEQVLDLFAGSGTTGIACMDLKRDCTLIEQEPDYCTVIEERLGIRRL
jgi:16S rRNA G966 N2-methylase RsmD